MNRRDFIRRMFGVSLTLAVSPIIIPTLEETLNITGPPPNLGTLVAETWEKYVSTSDPISPNYLWLVRNYFDPKPRRLGVITEITYTTRRD
jgi:hypothetical protein